MTLKKAVEILDTHQKWRTGEIDDICYTPKQLTEALDICIRLVKQFLNINEI